MDFGLKGLVRGTVDTLRSVTVGSQGQVFTSKLLPDYAQLVAENRVFHAAEATATASVVALPSTTALFCLNNNENDDGLWYVILQAYAFNSANAAALDTFGLAAFVMVNPKDTTFAQDIAKTSVKPMLSTGGAYSGNARIDTGVTLTTDDLWFPLGRSSGSTAINSATGASLAVDVNGLIIVPPGGATGLVSTATSTSCTTKKGFIWAEVPKSYLKAA